jgi:hypothetical protein
MCLLKLEVICLEEVLNGICFSVLDPTSDEFFRFLRSDIVSLA